MERLSPGFGIVLHARGSQLLPDAADLAELIGHHRCVLLRGFEATVEQFEQVSALLTSEFLTYRGGALRGASARSAINNNKTLMTASGGTQEDGLLLHAEQSYQPYPPDLLWFYCASPAAQGGETTVADGVALLQDLPSATARRFQAQKICYHQMLPDGQWQRSFQVASGDELEAYCRSQRIELRWTRGGAAITRFCCSALRDDGTGKLAFVNLLLQLAQGEDRSLRAQLTGMLHRIKGGRTGFFIRWEDGSPIEPNVVRDVREASLRQEVAVCWSRGDILVVDNRSLLHGRRQSFGGGRQILVRMGHLRPEFANGRIAV